MPIPKPGFDGVAMMLNFKHELQGHQDPAMHRLELKNLRLHEELSRLSHELVELTQENDRLRRRRFLWWLR